MAGDEPDDDAEARLDFVRAEQRALSALIADIERAFANLPNLPGPPGPGLIGDPQVRVFDARLGLRWDLHIPDIAKVLVQIARRGPRPRLSAAEEKRLRELPMADAQANKLEASWPKLLTDAEIIRGKK